MASWNATVHSTLHSIMSAYDRWRSFFEDFRVSAPSSGVSRVGVSAPALNLLSFLLCSSLYLPCPGSELSRRRAYEDSALDCAVNGKNPRPNRAGGEPRPLLRGPTRDGGVRRGGGTRQKGGQETTGESNKNSEPQSTADSLEGLGTGSSWRAPTGSGPSG